MDKQAVKRLCQLDDPLLKALKETLSHDEFFAFLRMPGYEKFMELVDDRILSEQVNLVKAAAQYAFIQETTPPASCGQFSQETKAPCLALGCGAGILAGLAASLLLGGQDASAQEAAIYFFGVGAGVGVLTYGVSRLFVLTAEQALNRRKNAAAVQRPQKKASQPFDTDCTP